MAAPDVLLAILTQMKTVLSKIGFLLKALYSHYCNRGGLSKNNWKVCWIKCGKQQTSLQGKIATVEAIILKTTKGKK